MAEVPNIQLSKAPVARTGMLIRSPVTQVFEVFVDPELTSRIWFSSGSGRLKPGAKVLWKWEMYDFSVDVTVKEYEQNRHLVIEWSSEIAPTTIEWLFTSLPDDTTFVSITNSGFAGTGDEMVKSALDSTEGFAFVLAALKAYLEYDVILNLVADRFPSGLEAS